MADSIREQLGELGIAVTQAQAERLSAYVDHLIRWNRVHNLTASSDRDEIVRRHIAESLALRNALKGARIADVGSGAGLPGIPLALVEPDRQFTLIESRGKRAAFLGHVSGALGLRNVEVVQSRVEDLREAAPFDTVLARAVAALPELVELTRHLLGEASVLLVPTKADYAAEAAALPDGFRFRRLQAAGQGVLMGALVAIERDRPE